MPGPVDVLVVAIPFKEGDDFLRGDRYDRTLVPLADELDRTLRFSRYVLPLTAENYAIAIGSRPIGTVGRGFTIDELVEWEIIDAAHGELLRKARLEGEWYEGYLIAPVKQGHFTRFEVRDARGEPVRPQRFTKHEKAVAYIDNLLAGGQSGAKESTDDVDLQPKSLEHAG